MVSFKTCDMPVIIPNLTLKKIMTDIISDGGSGLYCHDTSQNNRIFELKQENVLIWKCVAPTESDWNSRSFRVLSAGCIGGRNVYDNRSGKDPVIFKDSTVSRQHFEVFREKESGIFMLQDLGSAGGTYMRLMFRQRQDLHPGMIFMTGKHQFLVSSISFSENVTDADANSKKLGSSLRAAPVSTEVRTT